MRTAGGCCKTVIHALAEGQPCVAESPLRHHIFATTQKKMDIMVSRIRRTPTIGERAAAVERTNAIALEAAREERRRREEKTERLRKLRLEGSPEKPLTRS